MPRKTASNGSPSATSASAHAHEPVPKAATPAAPVPEATPSASPAPSAAASNAAPASPATDLGAWGNSARHMQQQWAHFWTQSLRQATQHLSADPFVNAANATNAANAAPAPAASALPNPFAPAFAANPLMAALASPFSANPFAAYNPFAFNQLAASLCAPLGSAAQQPTPAPTTALNTLQFDSEKLQATQKTYLEALSKLCNAGPTNATPPKDRRFGSEHWSQNPLAAFTAAAYALNAQALSGMADAVQADEKTRQRIRFAVDQWVAAMSPSNFLALNPEAVQKAIATNGQSLLNGLRNLLQDIERGHVSMTDESVFEVGRNVATTEGAVIFENDLFQLIEYKPLTVQVHARPLLLVPPCINKFYILDLQPENSLIRYAVEQGHRTFVMSWRNPDASLGHLSWDDYIEHAVLRAITTVQEASGAAQINTLGFCVGGTMLTTALAVLAARGQRGANSPVASATLLTTLLDFADTGILDVFIDEASVRLRELQMGQHGLMPGRELASTFSFLRPNDLVWNYVVGNYLKGETPPAFDLLYWNSDATNLPGPWYAWYLRNTYLENRLMQPGALTVCGVALDLSAIDVPVYLYGSREDHIVPISAAYASAHTLQGAASRRFVMGASGHIAGVINPPAKQKRSHWLRDDLGQGSTLPPTLAEWQASAQEHPGSWWTDWAAWLRQHAGANTPAPTHYGDGQRYTAIEAAPGRYVRQKA